MFSCWPYFTLPSLPYCLQVAQPNDALIFSAVKVLFFMGLIFSVLVLLQNQEITSIFALFSIDYPGLTTGIILELCRMLTGFSWSYSYQKCDNSSFFLAFGVSWSFTPPSRFPSWLHLWMWMSQLCGMIELNLYTWKKIITWKLYWSSASVIMSCCAHLLYGTTCLTNMVPCSTFYPPGSLHLYGVSADFDCWQLMFSNVLVQGCIAHVQA